MKQFLLIIFSICSIAHAQVFNWSTEVNSTYDYVSVNAVSPSGEVFVANFTKNPSPAYYGINDIVKYDTAGNQQWQYSIGGNARVENMIFDDGTLYFSGVFRDSLRMNDSLITAASFLDLSFIVSIDSDGTFNWLSTPWATKRLIYNLRFYEQSLYAITLGTGWGTGTISKFDLNGDLQNEQSLSGAVSISDFVYDDSNNVYISGYCNTGATFGSLTIPNTGSSYNSFILKTDANFNPIWVDAGPHITFDFESKVYMVDDTLYYFHARKTANTGATPYIFKYTQQGSFVDSVSFMDAWSPPFEHGWTKHNGEDVIIMLESQNAAAFNGLPLYYLDKNLSILRADTLRNLYSFYTFLSASDEAICITGKANYGFNYNSDTLLSFNGGSGNGIIHFNYDQDTPDSILNISNVQLSTSHLTLYPNPAKNEITLRHELNESLNIVIYSLAGAEVLRTRITESNNIIPVGSLSSGYYLLQAKSSTDSYTKKLIIQ